MGEHLREFLRAEFLALAFLGSLVALTFWPPTERTKAAINLVIGTVISVASSPAIIVGIAWMWPTLPAEFPVQGAVYFWIGVLGMKIVPVAAQWIERFKSAKIPGGE